MEIGILLGGAFCVYEEWKVGGVAMSVTRNDEEAGDGICCDRRHINSYICAGQVLDGAAWTHFAAGRVGVENL